LAGCEVAPAAPMTDLVISPEGAFTVDGKPVAEKDLARELRAARERAPSSMLIIRTDGSRLHPKEPIARKAIEEAGIVNITTGSYKEQEKARRTSILIRDTLFWGGIQLFALLVVTPLALRAKAPGSARSIAIVGVLAISILTGVIIGAYLGPKAGMDFGLSTIYMMIHLVPLSVITGVLAGVFFYYRARRLKSKA
jgi:hypothetical protein